MVGDSISRSVCYLIPCRKSTLLPRLCFQDSSLVIIQMYEIKPLSSQNSMKYNLFKGCTKTNLKVLSEAFVTSANSVDQDQPVHGHGQSGFTRFTIHLINSVKLNRFKFKEK